MFIYVCTDIHMMYTYTIIFLGGDGDTVCIFDCIVTLPS